MTAYRNLDAIFAEGIATAAAQKYLGWVRGGHPAEAERHEIMCVHIDPANIELPHPGVKTGADCAVMIDSKMTAVRNRTEWYLAMQVAKHDIWIGYPRTAS